MRALAAILIATVGTFTAACGATTRGRVDPVTMSPAITSATVSFHTLSNGKDADSAVGIQLLRNNAELAAETHATGIKFDDNSTSSPFALSMAGTFRKHDVDDGRLRVRMNPDGKDDWTFNMQASLTFADGTSQRFAWNGLRLDNGAREITLALNPARMP